MIKDGKMYKSNVGRMPELTDFAMVYSAAGKLIVVDLEMKDSLTGYIEDPQPFPDIHLSIRADMARELAHALLECADNIDAGLTHPTIKLVQ
ncbi:hypothetical protein [Atlantibacter subterraneus]|uniref:hypothetical protein n=1 Tax=Atlantibacter subterraneus TaxID=255519 RepID=UPI0028A1017D|nr:hypothetical protein [Atlantibacter subterranea]